MEEMNKKMYTELLKKTLIDYHRTGTEYRPLYSVKAGWKRRLLRGLDRFLRIKDYAICKINNSNKETRENGGDWPAYAESMIGLKRMDNIEFCVNNIITDNIPGDLIEAGVWRGGATIFMKGLLTINNIKNRVVWVADSFRGLPKPNEKYKIDKESTLHTYEELAIPVDVVRKNFEKYGLLDNGVKFLEGYFSDTLPKASIKTLSLIRADGDMYESTMDILVNLYPRLSIGGYIIFDDFNTIEGCKEAVMEYRHTHNINETIIKIDESGVFWRKNS
jgi:hypothetical protein